VLLISFRTPDDRVLTNNEWEIKSEDFEPYTLDAQNIGNIARFINHGCEPNCITVQIQIEHRDPHIPRIAFFAKKTIEKYEELTVDYHYKKMPFVCKCRKCAQQSNKEL
jgi:SET domain-containing protein